MAGPVQRAERLGALSTAVQYRWLVHKSIGTRSGPEITICGRRSGDDFATAKSKPSPKYASPQLARSTGMLGSRPDVLSFS